MMGGEVAKKRKTKNKEKQMALLEMVSKSITAKIQSIWVIKRNIKENKWKCQKW